MNQANIVLAEDERIAAMDIAKSLNRLGYNVASSVSSGKDAIEKCILLKPDLALLDIFLDGELDGISAAAQIRDRLGIPIVFLTAHADVRTLQRAQLVAPDGYIVKPFRDVELHAVLQIALSREHNGAARSTGASRLKGSSTLIQAGDFEVSKFLGSLDFFSDLNAGEVALCAQACRCRTVKAGTEISTFGSHQFNPFIVVQGRIASVGKTSQGKEFIANFLPAGDLAGLIPALEVGPITMSTRAQIDSIILEIPKPTFLLLLDAHPVLARRFAQYVVQRLRQSQQFSASTAHSKVACRIASVLLSLSPTPPLLQGVSEYDIEVSRLELAEICGCAMETVVRVIKGFEREGIVRLGRRRRITVIDITLLTSIARNA